MLVTIRMRKFVKYYTYFVFLATLFVAYAYTETHWIKINHLKVVNTQIPKEFVGKRMVFVSDIHHGPYFSIYRVNKLVAQINKLNPDIILLGGDYVHRNPVYIKPVFEALAKLKSKYGVYAIYGNHDHWEGYEATKLMMEGNNFKICDNKSYWVHIAADSIKIGGVGDYWEGEQLIDSTIHDVQASQFCVLLTHNPDYFENLDATKVDLALAGHTHGGQVTLFGLWAPVLPTVSGNKFRYGLKKVGSTQIYTTSGVGTITPPLRFFCRPEIVCIELKNK